MTRDRMFDYANWTWLERKLAELYASQEVIQKEIKIMEETIRSIDDWHSIISWNE